MSEKKNYDGFSEARPGEVSLSFDPATADADAGIVFIGHVSTPWTQRQDCPRNSLQADKECTVHIKQPFRPGLQSVDKCSHIILLYWMDQARRDLIIQSPRHADGSRGCFALRTPVRPNPVSLAVVKLIDCDLEAGTLRVLGVDCLDGTPLVDIKPYFSSTDCIPDAVVGWKNTEGQPYEPDKSPR